MSVPTKLKCDCGRWVAARITEPRYSQESFYGGNVFILRAGKIAVARAFCHQCYTSLEKKVRIK